MGRRQGSRAKLIVILIAAIVVLHDVSVPPRQAFGARAALYAISGYQAHISPHLNGIVECRFKPTCSHYGQQAIAKYGLLRGGIKTAGRLARCGPWTKLGTVDPPGVRRERNRFRVIPRCTRNLNIFKQAGSL